MGPEAGEGGVDEVGEDGLGERKVEGEGKERGEVCVEGGWTDEPGGEARRRRGKERRRWRDE